MLGITVEITTPEERWVPFCWSLDICLIPREKKHVAVTEEGTLTCQPGGNGHRTRNAHYGTLKEYGDDGGRFDHKMKYAHELYISGRLCCVQCASCTKRISESATDEDDFSTCICDLHSDKLHTLIHLTRRGDRRRLSELRRRGPRRA